MLGNPTILIPPLEATAENIRLVVTNSKKTKKVWQSHFLTASKDAVCVNCWDGAFINEFQGYAILPAGDYLSVLEGPNGFCRELTPFHVAEFQVFSATFTRPKDCWFSENAEWHESGRWNLETQGIVAKDKPSYVFVEGNMHGILTGRFQIDRNKIGCEFGLIARLYNAGCHIRVSMTCVKELLKIKLLRMSGSLPHDISVNLIAEGVISINSQIDHCVQWHFNGSGHAVWVDNKLVVSALDGYMGGVTVVGLFSEADAAHWRELSMQSTQPVPKYNIERPAYRAMIRPGNIKKLYLLQSEAPNQNLCWESGIQLGHIGGSEIKFTQNSRLDLVCKGDVYDQVRWQGPMPKFVEQCDDVRGWAHGAANFYPDRNVLADYVVTRTNRSVGPDFDLMARVLAGPARIALAGEKIFHEWILPDDGAIKSLEQQLQGRSEAFAVCVAFPMNLGGQLWWLKVIIANLLHIDNSPAVIFAWRCPYGLTASHDFRVSPTKPGVEYGFSIIVEWQQSDSIQIIEQDLLNLRDDWCTPVIIEPQTGSVISYETDRDQSVKAMEFTECFDRSKGMYRLRAENNLFHAHLDPLDIKRRSLMLEVEGFSTDEIECELNDRLLKSGHDYLEQHLPNGNKLIIIKNSINQKATLKIKRMS